MNEISVIVETENLFDKLSDAGYYFNQKDNSIHKLKKTD